MKTKNTKVSTTKYWVVAVWKDVEPELHGPYTTFTKMLNRAKICFSGGYSVYGLNQSGNKNPQIHSFSNGELE